MPTSAVDPHLLNRRRAVRRALEELVEAGWVEQFHIAGAITAIPEPRIHVVIQSRKIRTRVPSDVGRAATLVWSVLRSRAYQAGRAGQSARLSIPLRPHAPQPQKPQPQPHSPRPPRAQPHSQPRPRGPLNLDYLPQWVRTAQQPAPAK